MKQYLKLLKNISEKGIYKPPARAGMPGTKSLFGYQLRHNLGTGFPLLTSKKVNFDAVIHELLWFLNGETNIGYLVNNGVNIWNEDAYNYYKKVSDRTIGPSEFKYPLEEFIEHVKIEHQKPGSEKAIAGSSYQFGDTGKQYGKLWRHWKDEDGYIVDQVGNLIKGLRENPESRRHIITAWNPTTLEDMALPACHSFVQFNCRPTYATLPSSPKYILDCQVYMRSNDVFLGAPFNIASYSLLIHILCKMLNMLPGDYIHTIGDAHLYENQEEAIKEQLSRYPTKLPEISLNPHLDWVEIGKTLDFKKIKVTDFKLIDYKPQPAIKAKLSTGLR